MIGAVMTASEVRAQDFFGDLFREIRDENRVEQDYRDLARDAANGNVVGEVFDLMRLNQDQNNLMRDRQQLNYDLNGGYSNQNSSLIPHPNNPGYYYYPSNPGQMYYYPNQQVAPVANQAVARTPANPVPQVLQTVRIANPADTGVDLSFVFGGKTFSVESGQTKEFSISNPTLIVFSRGGQAGEARYTLTGGNTFEFKYDDAGWSMIQKRREQAVAKVVTDGLPVNPAPRPAVSPQIVSAPAPQP